MRGGDSSVGKRGVVRSRSSNVAYVSTVERIWCDEVMVDTRARAWLRFF